MLLIVTIGLLVAAAGTLVVGFVERSLPLDYVSIGASAVCVVLLVVFSSLNRARARREASSVGAGRGGAAPPLEDNRPTQLVEAVGGQTRRLGWRRRAGREAEGEWADADESDIEEEPLPEPLPVRRSFFSSGRRAQAEPAQLEPELIDGEPEEAEPEEAWEPEAAPVRRSLLARRRGGVAVVAPEPVAAGRRSPVGSGDGQAGELVDEEGHAYEDELVDEDEAGVPVRASRFDTEPAAEPSADPRWAAVPEWEEGDAPEAELLPEPVPARRSLFGSARRAPGRRGADVRGRGRREADLRPIAEEAHDDAAFAPVAADLDPDAVFPIADYDDLRVAEVLPLLSELVPDEYDMVRQREMAGRGRSTILRRLDELSAREEPGVGQERGAVEEGGAVARVPAAAAATTTTTTGFAPGPGPYAEGPHHYGDGPVSWEDAEEGLGPAAYAEADLFPIADYDDLRVAEIVPLLRQLDPEELEMVRSRERQGAGRTTILKRIDSLASSTDRVTSTNGSAARPTTRPAQEPRVADEVARAEAEAAEAARAARAAKARADRVRKAAAAQSVPAGRAQGSGQPGRASRPGGARSSGSAGAGSRSARSQTTRASGATKPAGSRTTRRDPGSARSASTKRAGARATKAAAPRTNRAPGQGVSASPPAETVPLLRTTRPSRLTGGNTRR